MQRTRHYLSPVIALAFYLSPPLNAAQGQRRLLGPSHDQKSIGRSLVEKVAPPLLRRVEQLRHKQRPPAPPLTSLDDPTTQNRSDESSDHDTPRSHYRALFKKPLVSTCGMICVGTGFIASLILTGIALRGLLP